MICPNCGSDIRAGEAFCPQCGAEVSAGDFAPQGQPAPSYAPQGAPPPPPPGAYYGAPPVSQGGGLATTSLILGIISTVFSLMSCIPYINYCTCIVGPIVAVVAIVLGIVAMSSAGPMHKSKATWGLVLGIVSIVITIVLVVLSVLGLVSLALISESSYSY